MTGDNPIGDFLVKLAAEVGGLIVDAWAKRVGEQIHDTPRERAIRNCLDAGLVAFLHQAQAEAPAYAELLETTDAFFHRADVIKEITRLLRGQPLDHEELRYLFEEAGYPHEGVFDFTAAMKNFEGIFLLRAVEEEVLQGMVQAGQLIKHTELAASQFGVLREILAFLDNVSLENIVSIEAGAIGVEGGGDVVYGDKVEGDKVVGDKHVYYYNIMPSEGGSALPDYWERHYLETLIAHCDRLDLTTLSTGEITADTPTISDVFTTLYLKDFRHRPDFSIDETDQLVQSELKWARGKVQGDWRYPITAKEAILSVQRLVILGQPGGGKSTLVNYVAAEMARKRIGRDSSLGQKDSVRLPVRIILRRFAEWLAAEKRTGDAGDVWDYIEHLLKRWGCADSYDGLRQTLINKGGIVFFDGLDEIKEAKARQPAVKGAVTAFAGGLQKCGVVVTSRPYAYTDKAGWRLPAREYPVVSLAAFDEEQIREFNRAWHLRVIRPLRDWDEEQCRQLADRLTQTIVRQPHLRRLAETPLLLTLIAQVNSKGGTLPENRADLYQQAVNLLLAGWENRIVLDAGPGVDVREDEVLWLGVPTGQLRDVLARLAYDGHQQQAQKPPEDDQAAEIRQADLKLALVARFDSGQKAEQIMDYIQHRAGLLVAQEEAVYSFPHRTFQEYLAARHLLNQPNWAKLLCDHLRAAPDWWREVFLLSAGIAISSLPDSIPQLLNTLLPFEPGTKAMPLSAESPAWVTTAAQALMETNFAYYVEQETEAGAFTAVYRRVQFWLKAVMVADDLLPVRVRAEAGQCLAQLGDDRPGVGIDPETGLPDIIWGEEVPAGEYTVGEGKNSREVTIERPFRLARYPVTNDQFQCFLEAEDFGDGRWWQGFPANEQSFRDPAFPDANCPREMINWYQAVAFCRWLNERLRKTLLEGTEIDLPHEYEWEAAARYPDNRQYPWGEAFDSAKANTREGEGIGQTSAVGIYPSGRNPTLDLFDLSGNVWEWQRNKFNYPAETAVDNSRTQRVVHGGAWSLYHLSARAAARFGYHPNARGYNIGFRVVVRRPPSHS